MRYSKMTGILLMGAMVVNLCGCGIRTTDTDESGKSTQESTTTEIVDLTLEDFLGDTEMFHEKEKEIGYDESETTLITFSDTGAVCSDSSVQIGNHGDTVQVTISSEGIYRLQGSSQNAQLLISAGEEEVRLVLDGVSLSNPSDAVLYAEEAEEVYITLAEDSENTFCTEGEFANENESVDAVIFSKPDLTLNGNGKLSITTDYGHGVVSKDDLKITQGSYQIHTSGHCLVGKDSVRICEGVLQLQSSRDGIHADHEEDEEKGYIYLTGGSFTVDAEDDGLDATGHIVITGGKLEISSKDDAVHGGRSILIEGGSFEIAAGDDGVHADGGLKVNGGTITITESYEGLEGNRIDIQGGTIDICASDDGMNAASASNNSNSEEGTVPEMPEGMEGKELPEMPEGEEVPEMPEDMEGKEPPEMPEGEEVPEMPEGMEGKELPEMPEGMEGKEMPEMPEGMEGKEPPQKPQTVSGGAASSEGDFKQTEAADSEDGEAKKEGKGHGMRGGAGGGFGGGFRDPDSDESCEIRITGGTITISAQGDGIDSNGTLVIEGGEIYISGPDYGGNGALDYGISGTISRGTIVAVGAAGMAESFSDDSEQAFISQNISGAAEDEIVLLDADGTELLRYTAEKTYGNIVLSCPQLQKGGSYVLKAGSQTVDVQI